MLNGTRNVRTGRSTVQAFEPPQSRSIGLDRVFVETVCGRGGHDFRELDLQRPAERVLVGREAEPDGIRHDSAARELEDGERQAAREVRGKTP